MRDRSAGIANADDLDLEHRRVGALPRHEPSEPRPVAVGELGLHIGGIRDRDRGDGWGNRHQGKSDAADDGSNRLAVDVIREGGRCIGTRSAQDGERGDRGEHRAHRISMSSTSRLLDWHGACGVRCSLEALRRRLSPGLPLSLALEAPRSAVLQSTKRATARRFTFAVGTAPSLANEGTQKSIDRFLIGKSCLGQIFTYWLIDQSAFFRAKPRSRPLIPLAALFVT